MRWREWLGVGERRWKKAPDEEVQPAKTLWDWLQLLVVPAILIGVTFAWSAAQTRNNNKRDDRRIAADRAAAETARQDATLQAYLDQMSGLMLNNKLLISEESDPVRQVARTITLTTLRRLDKKRKAEVVRFLYEAKLLRAGIPRVVLTDADLSHVDLVGADLERVNLSNADLGGAHLTGAVLPGAHFENADLRGAHLEDAYCEEANLQGAQLEGAHLEHPNLRFAHLPVAELGHAHLEHAELLFAYLWGADFRRADLSDADLEGADFENTRLGGANLRSANLVSVKNLDLGVFIDGLRPDQQKAFLNSQKKFLDSLSRQELAKFNLTPDKLAKFRREAKA